MHTYGKSLRDLVRLRRAIIPRIPDAVLYPADEDQVRAIVDLAVAEDVVIIPFGGGTNISGSLEPPPEETRPVLSVDLGRLNKVLDIDAESGLARIQAGTLGPDLEEQLGARGWTMGHFPDSFTHSTLGGWVATRSSGMQSDKYGDIADITRGLRVVVPGDVLVIRPLPSTATGPSVREMILGSEGRLGVITEVTVQVHRVPEERIILGYLFPTWESGMATMQEIAASDAAPTVTRVSDSRETAFSFATSKPKPGFDLSGKLQKGLFAVLQRRGWDMYQGLPVVHGLRGRQEPRRVRTQAGQGHRRQARRHRGRHRPRSALRPEEVRHPVPAGLPARPRRRWRRLRDRRTVVPADGGLRQHRRGGEPGVRPDRRQRAGSCATCRTATTRAPACTSPSPSRWTTPTRWSGYDVVKSAIQQSFVDHGGTLSHHHSVGTEHSRWMVEDISGPGVAMIDGVFERRRSRPELQPRQGHRELTVALRPAGSRECADEFDVGLTLVLDGPAAAVGPG